MFGSVETYDDEEESLQTYWRDRHTVSSSSSSQQISQQKANAWMRPTTSLYENVNELLHFTVPSKSCLWNTSCTEFMIDESETQDVEEVIDDTLSGKNYDVFEQRLNEGYLEANGLALVAAPPAIFDYKPPLKRIDLKDNKIELLPENFFDELPMLNWCDIRYNRLESIPAMNQEHKNLNVLLLQDNQIQDLPCSLAYAVNLKTLGWTNNCIVNPPQAILLQGCPAIMKYLRNELNERLPIDQSGNLKEFPNDDELKKDLQNISVKGLARRSSSRCTIASRRSRESTAEVESEEKRQQKRIDRIKYTWGLWKDIPYQGVSNQTLFEKSVQEVKDEVKAQFNQRKNAILQKIKDNEAVSKWRKDARTMQLQGSLKPYAGVSEPFGTDKDSQSDSTRNDLTPEKFRSILQDCMKRLQSFSANPVPLQKSQESLKRLKEVEDIHKKITNLKLTYSVQNNNLL